MSSEEQADAYLEEAELTLESARSIFEAADENSQMWAQVVKNGYDAIEQAVSAGIAAEDEAIPRRHPAKINRFIELYEPTEAVESTLHEWLRRRSEAQYVDIRGDEVNIPHELFDQEDAQQMIQDAEMILQNVRDQIE